MLARVNIHTHHPAPAQLTLRSAGVHPWQAAEADLVAVESVAAQVDAIGEIGLDKVCTVPLSVQESVFRAQLQLAVKCRKPVVLHVVRAFEEVMRILQEYPLTAVIFHGFLGSSQQAARAIKRGYYLSFGTRTAASPRTVQALRDVPAEQLFVETDESTEPLDAVYECIAALRGTTAETLAAQTLANYKHLLQNG